MTPALRWAAMRASLMFFINCKGQSHKIVCTDHNFEREKRAEADLNRGPSAYQYQPNTLPLSQTGSQNWVGRPQKWSFALLWLGLEPMVAGSPAKHANHWGTTTPHHPFPVKSVSRILLILGFISLIRNHISTYWNDGVPTSLKNKTYIFTWNQGPVFASSSYS